MKMDYPARPTLAQRACAGLITRLLSHFAGGELTLILPDGARRTFGPGGGRRAELRVRRWSFFTRLARGGDVGLGEAYQHGDYDTPDLVALIRLFIDNEDALKARYGRLARLGKAADRFGHLLRANSRTGSRRNIAAHYDLSNEMFELFLDDSMTYSCAVFETPQASLAEAQAAKRRRIIEKARLRDGDRILEIGSGWGSLAVDMAKAADVRVTSITLSQEQLASARRRAEAAGVADRVTFALCDYRAVRGRFDKIVSVEMIEAVGHEFLDDYFAAIDGLLARDGLAVIQAITVPDHRYDAYRRGCDWIQKHIFPGAVVPSVTALAQAMTARTRLMIEDLDNIGIHYAKTLRLWRRSFLAGRAEIERLGFGETFMRTWEYYFCYCEAGFASRELGDVQLVLTRPNNRRLPAH